MVDTPRGQAASMTPVDIGAAYSQNIQVRYGASLGIVRGSGADWFGPLNPQAPSAPPEVAGRAFNYMPGFNLQTRPRANEIVNFATMRGLADSYDLLRLVIETRKDQITKTKWKIRVKPDNDPNTREAGATAEQQSRIDYLTAFFERPDGVQKWRPWLRSVLEDTFVVDAATLYKRRNRGGNLIALEQLDGATIKVVIDDWGRTPQPYMLGGQIFYPPAFQQNLAGLPAVNYSTKDVLYRPYNKRVHKAYGYCYDAETEILTKHRGWVQFPDLIEGEEVATRSENGRFEWQVPSRVVREPWAGEMIHFSSRSMDLMVTPEHRMLVTALPRGLGGNKTRRGEVVIRADDFATHMNRAVKIPVTSEWDGVEISQQAFSSDGNGQISVSRSLADGTVQVFERSANKPVTLCLSGDDFCALMGAYIAEGNIRSQGGIEVAQLSKSKGYELYKTLFERIGGSYNGRAFVLSRRAITEFFQQFGLAHEKFVPESIRNATPRQLRIFWDYYMAGDGSFDRRVNKSGRGKHPAFTVTATTVSKRLADHLVEIAQKIGMSASVSHRPAGRQRILDYYSDCRDSYRVKFRYSKSMNVRSRRAHYEGKVYCVTVPNGIVYVRRNGKPAWSGNSPVEQVITTVNIAMRRQAFQLGYYTEGNIPEALIGTPDGWTPEQIVAFQNAWDAMFTGNLAQRRHAKFVPGGVAKTFVPTKEPDLKNPMDDWLARIVCFAFSISPQQLVTMMNRATAQTSDTQAKEEGNEPLKEYIKEIVDDVIDAEFNSPDLEMAWDDEIVVDEEKQTEIITKKVQAGEITINRGRELMGEEPATDPGADQLMVLTASGYVPIGANTVDGKKEAIAAGIVADPTAVPEPPVGAFGRPGATKPSPGATKPAKKPVPPAKAQKLALARNVMGVFKASEVIEPVPFPFPQNRNAV